MQSILHPNWLRGLTLTAIAIAVTTWLAPPAAAQYRTGGVRNGVISAGLAGRYGLKRAWLTQIQLDSSRARVAHVTQHVSQTKFYTVFEVKDEFGKSLFSERDVNRYGQPVGVEGAKQLAKELVQKLKNEAKQADAHYKELHVPEVALFVQTDRGTLHALDGATGRTLWVARVGNQNYPTLQPGANDQYVGVVNGSSLIILDRANGKEAFTRRLASAPGAGPVLTDEHIFVPLVNGFMESFSLENHRKPPWRHASTGRLFVQPTVATNSVAWATDRGYLYVGHKDKRGVRFRLEARDAIVAGATFQPPNRIYAASIDGYVYCMHEFSGDMIWRYSVGDPVSTTPISTKDAVYALADDAGLYRINTQHGIEEWFSPRIRRLVGVSNDRIYCVGGVGELVILDAATGGRIDTMPLGEIDMLHLNWQTDRIYVGTKDGVLQCLHEIDLDFPVVHNIPDPETTAKPKVVQGKGDEPADEPANEDPFGGGGDDPFGGGGDDPFGGGGDDPFGGGDAGGDPFGGGDAGGGDPFGGDAGGGDPFGGGDTGGDDPFGGGGGGDPFGGADDDPFG